MGKQMVVVIHHCPYKALKITLSEVSGQQRQQNVPVFVVTKPDGADKGPSDYVMAQSGIIDSCPAWHRQ